jgi:UDPglucose 6-dehydrogenase
MTTDVYGSASGASAFILVTEWAEYKTLDYQRLYDAMLKPAYFFDGRNQLNPEEL